MKITSTESTNAATIATEAGTKYASTWISLLSQARTAPPHRSAQQCHSRMTFVGLGAENYAGAMSSEEKTAPVRLEIHLFHDGRVALELMSDWYTNLDLQLLHVDDAAAISSLMQRWSAGEYGEPQRQYIRQEAVPGITEAYKVEIGARPTSELQRFTNLPEKLCDEFERALIVASSERRSYAAEFASNLSSKMREFLAISQRKAEARIADGAYLKVLETYLADMLSRTQPRTRTITLRLSPASA